LISTVMAPYARAAAISAAAGQTTLDLSTERNTSQSIAAGAAQGRHAARSRNRGPGEHADPLRRPHPRAGLVDIHLPLRSI